MPQCLAAWPEVWVPLRADSHERKRRAAGSAAPVFCYCVLRGTEPSEKCVYIRFLELGTACVPQVHKTWAHWTDKALRLAYICQTQETLSTLRLFSAQKVHIYIYIILQYPYPKADRTFTSASCCRFFQDTSGTFRA